MCPRNGKRVIPWTASLLALVLVTLTGCVRVRIVDTTPAASTPVPIPSSPSPGNTDHNLAITAVDFDPPLNYQQLIIQRQSLALLVAIENNGSSTERNVTVRAQLSSPEDPDLFLTQGASIASIAPGEVEVVRFSRLGEIPYHQTYHLEVMVDPVAGESDLGDSSKAFDIQILLEQESP
jgi:hypothetical protein